jgi:hypothetical protein
MMHLYTTRHYRNDTVKLLCTRENVTATRDTVTTVPENVTCSKCLDVLIPKFETKLQKMKINRMIEAKESGEAVVSPNCEVPITSGDATL